MVSNRQNDSVQNHHLMKEAEKKSIDAKKEEIYEALRSCETCLSSYSS